MTRTTTTSTVFAALFAFASFSLLASSAHAISIDTPIFSQSTFDAGLSGWTFPGGIGVQGANDPDGQSAMNSGFSGQSTFMWIDSGATIQPGATYYYQVDYRLEEAFNDGNWVDGVGDNDRPISQRLRYTSGGANIFDQTVTVTAAAS
ncbi:MAG: hypothetical protein KDA42_09960, partial [Planctomycetales bacterium]|nr:hypothetical protein [Planctomycetales bacterium]